jgi:hypothetical protein
MSSNLPPGVCDNDIPGNRPEDQEWDDLLDFLSDCGLAAIEIRAAIEEHIRRAEDQDTTTIPTIERTLNFFTKEKMKEMDAPFPSEKGYENWLDDGLST